MVVVSKKTTALHIMVLALFAIIAYWPLSSFHHATRWDSVESYFPFRYFLSDCLRHGQLPLWMPYQLGGSPFYADPQSSAWYPVAWIFGFAAPYSLHSFAVEYLFSFFMGGLGMYQLVKSFGLKPAVALIAGISYTACGFFVSNAEHLTWVVSATWIPWVFWAYHKMIETKSWGYVLLGGLFLFLLLSGGYPAFITVSLYLIVLFFLVKMLEKQSARNRWKMLWLHVSLAAVFTLLSIGLIVSWLQFIPLMSRGEGMTLAQVLVYPFSPRCFDSFLLPFSTLKGDELFHSDVSMRNAYMGLLCLIMLPFGLFQIRKNRKLFVLALATFLCLGIALGGHLPLRAFLYHYVPGMDLFRFPSLFRIFFIVGGIVLAAHGLNAFFDNKKKQRKWLGLAVGLLLSLCLVLLFRSIWHYGFSWKWGFSTNAFRSNLLIATRAELVQLQVIVQAGLLSFLLLLLSFRKGKWLRSNLLVAFCFLDMVLATGLNDYGTVVTMQAMSDQERPIIQAPRNFIVPDNSVPVSTFSDEKRNFGLLRTNTSIYFKTIAVDGYNSFQLISYNKFGASAIGHQVWSNPYLYFANGIDKGGEKDSLKNAKNIRLNTADYDALQQLLFSNEAIQQIKVTQFLPNKIVAAVSTPQVAIINLQQSYARGWKLTIDGKETPILLSNFTQMAAVVPAGNHELTWTFNPPRIKLLAAFTVSLLLLLGISFLGYRKRLFS